MVIIFGMNSVKFESELYDQSKPELYLNQSVTPQKSIKKYQGIQHTTKLKQIQKSDDKVIKFSSHILAHNNQANYTALVKKVKKSVWTKEEDDLLKQKVRQQGPVQWAQIASFLPNRSGKQCRERWHNHLRQGVLKSAWGMYEYWILALCVRAFGRKWSVISQHIPGRSDNTIKNQWNCKMKPYRIQFQHRIQRLIKNPESWSALNLKNQQIQLLNIIKNGQGQEKQIYSKSLMKKLIQKYKLILMNGISQYKQTKNSLINEDKKNQKRTCTQRIQHQYEFAIKINFKQQTCNQLELDRKIEKELLNVSESIKYQANQMQQIQICPGDLSAAISGGDQMFQDSDMPNSMMPSLF